MKLSNYLFFTANCETALRFYTTCGFGSVATMVRHGDNGMPVRMESMRGKIMHAQFTGPGVDFFASDNDDAEPMRGFRHDVRARRPTRDGASVSMPG